MSKIFISGPITGAPNYKKAFFDEEKRLSQQGHIVLNPCRLPSGLSESDYMRICMAMIDAAEIVVMLYGWSDSIGAMAEYYYAKKCGKRIGYRCSPVPLSEVYGKRRTNSDVMEKRKFAVRNRRMDER